MLDVSRKFGRISIPIGDAVTGLVLFTAQRFWSASFARLVRLDFFGISLSTNEIDDFSKKGSDEQSAQRIKSLSISDAQFVEV